MAVRTTYQVSGMTCDHCASAVTSELQALTPVEDVHVDLPTGTVTVTATEPLPTDQVRTAVDEAGYTLTDEGGNGD